MRHTKRIVERFKNIGWGESVKDVDECHQQRKRGEPSKISGEKYMSDKVELWGGFGEKKSNKGKQWYQQDRIYNTNGVCPALSTFKSDYWIAIPKDKKIK